MELREMTFVETQMFVTLKMIEKGKIDEMFEDLKKQSWVLQAIEKHFKARELIVEKEVQMMILIMGNGVVGRCVQFIDFIEKNAKGSTTVTFQDYIFKYFPMGIPVLN